MTALSLRNPIAILMASIAVVVFAAVVTPRMSVDTFPELTPPVLVIGTQVPGLGPKDATRRRRARERGRRSGARIVVSGCRTSISFVSPPAVC